MASTGFLHGPCVRGRTRARLHSCVSSYTSDVLAFLDKEGTAELYAFIVGLSLEVFLSGFACYGMVLGVHDCVATNTFRAGEMGVFDVYRHLL